MATEDRGLAEFDLRVGARYATIIVGVWLFMSALIWHHGEVVGSLDWILGLGVLVLTVFAALASLGAILAELGVSPGASRTATQLALATTTIALSWAFTHTIFALHYAHDFYGDYGGKRSGLNFPGEEEPDYWDFVYFSFVIGMTSQVSDVAVTSQLIRRTVNAHGIVSFFFNATLLALTVNIAASAI